jgi:hypothetical protein
MIGSGFRRQLEANGCLLAAIAARIQDAQRDGAGAANSAKPDRLPNDSAFVREQFSAGPAAGKITRHK